MGIPKFFYWLSERYPLCSQVIEEVGIPEFDNLYLDMNGIIHNCAYNHDEKVNNRLPDSVVFQKIFDYIEFLFNTIKPQKIFYMALDGVAPRAKMNQQRARRFRTAQDKLTAVRKAEREGVFLDSENSFDSNCITPGTEFMAKLTRYLKYFITRKVTEDARWQGLKVILSGHEVPGEGEHKIMEFIRLAKAQPDYNPNMRHCLYGLDADLIMLGLVAHEPHLALLREEVKFGAARSKDVNFSSAASQRFFLLHMSLLREYFEMEFEDVRRRLSFAFDLERVIDDFIVFAMLLGNDFIPHLPSLHINEKGIDFLFATYKQVLPTLTGYLNNHGRLDRRNFERFLRQLEAYNLKADKERITSNVALAEPQGSAAAPVTVNTPPSITSYQQSLIPTVVGFATQWDKETLVLVESNPDVHQFLQQLAENLGLDYQLQPASNANDDESVILGIITIPESQADEARLMDRCRQVYRRYQIVPQRSDNGMVAPSTAEPRASGLSPNPAEVTKQKAQYYHQKLEIDYHNPAEIRAIVTEYIKVIEWVLHYYYRGVVSWGYFYPYHYAPQLSDLCDLDSLDIHFELGTPFRPFEQLMGVLPALSRELIPCGYRDLMTDFTSPIIDFYPDKFRTDLNGKKRDWEAVVLIPFIDQDRLQAAMKTKAHLLTEEERERNAFGHDLLFQFTRTNLPQFESPLPNVFPAVHPSHCRMHPYALPTLEGGLEFRMGLCEGALVGAKLLPGFPSMNTLSLTSSIEKCGVCVHDRTSRNESITLRLADSPMDAKSPTDVAFKLVHNRIHIDWPYLIEGKVVAVHDLERRYTVVTDPSQPKGRKVVTHPLTTDEREEVRARLDQYLMQCQFKKATYVGDYKLVVEVVRLQRMQIDRDGWIRRVYYPASECEYFPLKMVIPRLLYSDQRFVERLLPSVKKAKLTPGGSCIFLVPNFYGRLATVVSSDLQVLAIKVDIPHHHGSPVYDAARQEQLQLGAQLLNAYYGRRSTYMSQLKVAKQLNIPMSSVSKLLSQLKLTDLKGQNYNAGLRWKHHMQNLKVTEFVDRVKDMWLVSPKGLQILQEYRKRFPELFTFLKKPRQPVYSAQAIFGSADKAATRMAELDAWLQSLGVRNYTAEDAEALAPPAQAIAVLEKDAAKVHLRLQAAAGGQKTVQVANVPRLAVLHLEEAPLRLNTQTFQLGDRVVHLDKLAKVPFGLEGYVVVQAENKVGVLFDEPFEFGTSLDNHCTDGRGFFVGKTSVLNLTRPQAVYATAAASSQSRGPRPQRPHPANRAPQHPHHPRPPANAWGRPARPHAYPRPAAPPAATPTPAPRPRQHTPRPAARPARPAPKDKPAPSQTNALMGSLLKQMQQASLHDHPPPTNGNASGTTAQAQANSAVAQANLNLANALQAMKKSP
ncbi:exonuclease II Exo2 [Dimargaris verticillata]|uniref:5'-3' exoribonuclease 1 n=1 Tax=Dimargaris verticillata TaxID=2761393 RepID=A0A9W8B809_9FUNG|nr:exonuclease II Exo2 [Dimargaris verticillata]